MDVINYVSLAIGLIGALIIVWGALVSAIQLGSIERKRFTGKNLYVKRNRIRHYLSTYLLTGLEYMIGADVIRTVIRPTLQELIILGSMVAIRTVISYFLNKEMKYYRE
ncbi:MAG TPA: DUF1622 domain-containing protein [Rhabdochlamydiaceae bacterium]|nr:DUF1622 domain-containing protein [Rhabdochlamydiaceae bacterium]